MYIVAVESSFSAAHFLRGYKGKCENLHGHRFKVVARLKFAGLNKIGLAYDFTEFKRQLAEVIKKYDHCCLNETKPFDVINPSSENIAATLYEQLLARVPAEGVVDSVEVWESPDSYAAYRPG